MEYGVLRTEYLASDLVMTTSMLHDENRRVPSNDPGCQLQAGSSVTASNPSNYNLSYYDPIDSVLHTQFDHIN